MKIGSIAGVFVLIVLTCCISATGADRTVVLLSVDGLAHFYFDDPKAQMPTIRRLLTEGAWADKGMLPVMPTVTWPNHTTLVTGVTPARHGVVGNVVFDRDGGKVVPFIWDSLFDKTKIVKVPTIYDLAKDAGMQTASITWPATRNATTLDWTMPDVGTQALFDKYSTPALLKECADAGIATDEAGAWFGTGDFLHRDRLATRAFNLILQAHRPRLGLLHLLNVDHIEHMTGPSTSEVYAAIKEADERVRDVWEELKKDYAGSATLLVVSDHGFLPYRQAVFPNVILRQAGLIEVRQARITSAKVRAVSEGGSCFLYVLDAPGRDAILATIAEKFHDAEGVGLVIMPKDFAHYGLADPATIPVAPDVVLSAKEGYIFGDPAMGDVAVTPPSDTVRGMHGYDNQEPAMQATFVAWGADVNAGKKLGAIQNVDVAPTIARLLQIEMKGVDGNPLPLQTP